MKRYDFVCSYDGGGPAEPQESEQGEFVKYEDALAEVAAERERWHSIAVEAAEIERLRHLP